MLGKYLPIVRNISRFGSTGLTSSFATARIDYYKVLQIDSSASEQKIRNAYAEMTEDLHPDKHPKEFKQLSEAFVILTDAKTREAYDSLLEVKKRFYLNDEAPKEILKKSYWAERKDAKFEKMKKMLNIDEFGRFKGGLPNKRGFLRGRSQEQTGKRFRDQDVEQVDRHPEYGVVSEERAQGFKDFFQDQRETRTMKWPWFRVDVDYEYLTFPYLRKKIWPWVQFLVVVCYIIPVFSQLYFGRERLAAEKQFIKRAENKRAASESKNNE